MQASEGKPLLRGHFHQAAFFFALGACCMLLAKAHSLRVFVPALIYALSLSGMFGISALYHRPKWNAKQRVIMKRIDHSAIFILIAGTATPLFMLALPHDLGVQLMVMIWMVAALGVAKCLLWVHSPKWVSALLYVGVGWLAGSHLGAIRQALGPGGFNCLLLGGVVYSIGAFIYAFRWPDPSPRYFGYHEIFHVLVIAAAALQFIAIQPFVR